MLSLICAAFNVSQINSITPERPDASFVRLFLDTSQRLSLVYYFIVIIHYSGT